MLSRERALELLHSQQPEAHLIQHALATEAVLAALAEQLHEDTALWAMTGLLHDLDYPHTHATPERHGLYSAELLAEQLPQEALHAIKAHNDCTGVAPAAPFDWALRCGETVTGLVVTAALVRPTGMDGMEAKSLKKKMKDKAFAASVCRDTIRECERIGLDLDSFLSLAIRAMTPQAAALGLLKGV